MIGASACARKRGRAATTRVAMDSDSDGGRLSDRRCDFSSSPACRRPPTRRWERNVVAAYTFLSSILTVVEQSRRGEHDPPIFERVLCGLGRMVRCGAVACSQARVHRKAGAGAMDDLGSGQACSVCPVSSTRWAGAASFVAGSRRGAKLIRSYQ
jgi:hypothetical protein